MKKLLAFILVINLAYYTRDVEDSEYMTDSQVGCADDCLEEAEPHCPPDEDCFPTIHTQRI